jgi:hypothetical protein
MINLPVSIYIADMQDRLDAPYRAKAVIWNFAVSLVLAFGLGFFLLVL